MAKRKIQYYQLYFTPGGSGWVGFKLLDHPEMLYTTQLSSMDLAALAAVLAQRNIIWDDKRNLFMSTDDDHDKNYNPSLPA